MNGRDQKILQEIKPRLEPPSQEEIDQVMAKWLFGGKAEEMLKHAPWSFVLTKLMWQEGEAPWQK